MKSSLLGFILFVFFNNSSIAQNGVLTGNFRINTDFYILDSSIGAVGANYSNNKNSANSWLQLNYRVDTWGFETGIRLDLNYNSILQNPTTPYSSYGIGNWFVKKKFDKFEVQGGYIYEQYGTGIALRSFFERNIGIDNSIFGAKINYRFSKDIAAKAIIGVQNNPYGTLKSFIKGFNIEQNKTINDQLSINSGASIVNRTLDPDYRNQLFSQIILYPKEMQFAPVYNSYVFHAYNTINYKNISWYIEGAYKTKEAVYNQFDGLYHNKDGSSIYTTFTYTQTGLGVTFQARRTDNFQFHSNSLTNPNASYVNNKKLEFITPINKQNSLRIPARLQAVAQELGEMAESIDISYALSKKVSVNINGCIIDTTDWSDPYYRELFIDFEFKKLLKGKVKAHLGVQYQYFNQKVYVLKEVADVEAYSAFTEVTYKFDRKKSLRVELQYQNAQKDMGQSVFGLVEFNFAPIWSFSVTDYYNFAPNPHYYNEINRTAKNYYTANIACNMEKYRFSLGYVTQFGGIICTGGVCRMEPAFSGVRAELTTTF
jgi:hypothetical protein